MSGQSLGMFIFTMAIAFAAIRAEDLPSSMAFSPPSTRGPASVSGKKIVFEEASLSAKHTSKVRGPMEVSVELVGARPNAEGDVFVLKGVVVSSEALRDVEYFWKIPAELELVNGSVKSVISDLNAGQPYTMQMTLRQKGFANGRVHFRARGSHGGLKFGDSAQYNSMMQETLEASRAELKKSSEEELAVQKASGAVPSRKNIKFSEEKHKHGDLKVFH